MQPATQRSRDELLRRVSLWRWAKRTSILTSATASSAANEAQRHWSIPNLGLHNTRHQEETGLLSLSGLSRARWPQKTERYNHESSCVTDRHTLLSGAKACHSVLSGNSVGGSIYSSHYAWDTIKCERRLTAGPHHYALHTAGTAASHSDSGCSLFLPDFFRKRQACFVLFLFLFPRARECR